MTHLGTHVEAPSHHAKNTKDVTAIPIEHFVTRGVLLRLDTVQPRQVITREQIEAADNGRTRPGDAVLLDSPFHAEPFIDHPNDQRPLLSSAVCRWCYDNKIKALGFGDSIDIENSPDCLECHDIMLDNDILFIEVSREFPACLDAIV